MTCAPAAWSSRPSSKPSIIEPVPSSRGKSSPLPPGNSAPSMLPVKSIWTWSPCVEARSTSIHSRFCCRSLSIMRSISASTTSQTAFSSFSSSSGASSISGKTSKLAVNLRPAPGSLLTVSMVGWPAGRSASWLIASAKELCSNSPTTSSRTRRPNRCLTTESGARPLRNPSILTFLHRSSRRDLT